MILKSAPMKRESNLKIPENKDIISDAKATNEATVETRTQVRIIIFSILHFNYHPFQSTTNGSLGERPMFATS